MERDINVNKHRTLHLRLPTALHRRLVDEAKRCGRSLNEEINSRLAKAEDEGGGG